jgi:glycosyltransferase involved in cell wall biosynthesis
VIHVHFAVPAGPAALVVSRLTGIPYLLTAHLGDVPGGTPEKTGRWFRWIYPFTPPVWKLAARVVAVSEFTRELAIRSYPVEVQVIPNGVDLAALDPGSLRAGSPPLVVFAGRFVTQKNPLQVVRTLAELRDLPWRCAMLGDGPLRAEVEAEIDRRGLRDRFLLPG